MKRFITVLSSLLILPAFAEVAPVYYDEIVEYTDEMLDAVDPAEETPAKEVAAPKNVSQRTTINRSTSRAISAAGTQTSQRSGASSRAMASSSRATTARTTVSRTATRPSNVVSRASASRNANVVSRSSRANTTVKPVTARVGTSSNPVMGAYKNTGGSSAAYLDDTNSTYNATTSARAASNRRATARMSTGLTSVSTTPVITEEDITTTTSNLTAIAELTDYCKAQYAACMDNYCNVLDDNQGRCSCSKNVKNYEKTEQALAKATEDFQDTVQKIKYIGLSADQITALFAETEAELTMKSKSDSSQLKTSLDSIKRKIVDASSPNASSSASNVSLNASGLFDLDLSSGFDLNSFLNTGNSSGTTSVSNQRGEQLFKTATNRCKTAVLNSCVAQGIDANVITNSYDLEIDKQCIAYERSLNDANSEMRQNVANAATILQQARLVLAQSKNSYDVRGCVAAIDSCMQDEYICGSDYELCLDPTGKYLANGEIVKGGTPGVSGGAIVNKLPVGATQDTQAPTEYSVDLNGWTSEGMYNLYSVWNYTEDDGPATSSTSADQDLRNPWGRGKSENLNAYIDSVLKNYWAKSNNYTSTTSTDDIAVYLLRKIGYIDSKDNNKVHGMCASIMKQCQDYTYKNDKYQPDNEVIRQYLASALTKIKLQQDSILADYAEDCRSDVSSCLSTNGYDESNPKSSASTTAVNACRADITTCMSVGGYMPKDNATLTLRNMSDWVASMLQVCNTNEYLDESSDGTVSCKKCGSAQVATFNENGQPQTSNKTVLLESAGGQVTSCHCPSEYKSYEHTTTSAGTPRTTLYCIAESESDD